MTNKIFSGALLIGFLMIFASCAKDDITSPQNNDLQEITENGFATDRAPVVPFKGSYDTHPAFNDPNVELLCDPGDAPALDALLFTIPGEGNATHLGNSIWSSESFVFSFGTPNGEGVYPASQTGCMIFTAADGSTLIGEYCGCVTFYDPLPLGAEGDGQYIMIDGTGRFEGATGYGEYSYYVESEFDANGALLAHLDFDGFLDKKGNTDYELVCEAECILDGE